MDSDSTEGTKRVTQSTSATSKLQPFEEKVEKLLVPEDLTEALMPVVSARFRQSGRTNEERFKHNVTQKWAVNAKTVGSALNKAYRYLRKAEDLKRKERLWAWKTVTGARTRRSARKRDLGSIYACQPTSNVLRMDV